MSEVLGYFDPLMDVGTTPASFIQELKTRITGCGWQLLHEDTSSSPYIDLVPPSGQAIGNSLGREVIRLRAPVSGSILEIHTYLEAMSDLSKQSFVLLPSTYLRSAYYASAGVTIGSGAVVVSTQSTVDATFASLQAALLASANTDVQKFDYVLTDPGDSDNAYITCTAKATEPNIAIGLAGAASPIIKMRSDGVPSGSHIIRSFQRVGTLSLDYTFGFLYYLSVHARTITIGIKTNAGIYGPLFATYADNAASLACTPAGTIPIELVAGDSGSSSAEGKINAKITHTWGYCGGTTTHADAPSNENAVTDYFACKIISGSVSPGDGVISDFSALCNWSGFFISTAPSELAIGGIRSASTKTNWNLLGYPEIVSFGLIGGQPTNLGSFSTRQGSAYTSVDAALFVPSVSTPDVYAYMGAASNEGLRVVRSGISTTLQTTMDGASDYPSIVVGSATGLPTSGTIVIGSECITFAGRSGTTLTGCVRAKYATTRAAHAINDVVYLATWIVRLNDGVIHCGTTKPS